MLPVQVDDHPQARLQALVNLYNVSFDEESRYAVLMEVSRCC